MGSYISKLVKEVGPMWHDRRGITGLETAIVLIAFVVVSSVFAFATLSTGLFSSDEAKKTIQAGLAEAQGTLEVKGVVLANLSITIITTTAVTAEAVGTGDGAATVFTLANNPVLTNSETVYLDGASQTRGVNYTINFDTGAITFTAAPGAGVAVTADYTHGIEAVGTGDGAVTVFNLDNGPVIVGSETIYLDGVVQTDGTNYTVNYNTNPAVVTFTAAPANTVRVDAIYTHYTVDTLVFQVANAAGGRAVDLTPGETIIAYQDADNLASAITDYGLTWLGTNDGDNQLETDEVAQISVPVSTYTIYAGKVFTIQVKPQQGAVMRIQRTLPPGISAVMTIN